MGDQAPATRGTVRQWLGPKVSILLTIPCVPAARMGMLSSADGDAICVCGALANLPPPPRIPSSGTSSSYSSHSPVAPAPCSGWVSGQLFWGGQWLVDQPACPCLPFSSCSPAAEAKFCFLHSLLVSAVDGDMPVLSCHGQERG